MTASEQNAQAALEKEGYTQIRDIKSGPEGISARAVKDGQEVSVVVDADGRVKRRSDHTISSACKLVCRIGPARELGETSSAQQEPLCKVKLLMTYELKPLPFDPTKIRGLSERMLVSHYENNYGGAVRRLNSITDQLADLDYEKAPVFVINGLKREELIATNSMILHECYFSGLGERNEPGSALVEAINRHFGGLDHWSSQFAAMARAQGGWCSIVDWLSPGRSGAPWMPPQLTRTESEPVSYS